MNQYLKTILTILPLMLASCGQVPPANNNPLETQSTSFWYFLPATSGTPLTFTSRGYHDGGASMDIIYGNYQSWPVTAVREGEIVKAVTGKSQCIGCFDSDEYYGNYLIIRHPDNTCAVYAHFANINITNGSVQRNQFLGMAGTTGNSDAIHVHFEIRPVGSCDWWLDENAVRPSWAEIGGAEWQPGVPLTSQNTGGGGCTSNCPTSLSKEMIGKARASTSLNFNLSDYVFNLYGTNPNDSDQLWDIFAPGGFPGGSNAGWMIRRKGTTKCLNAYRPQLVDGTLPNPYDCGAGDGDQQWEFEDKGDVNGTREWRIHLIGTQYCLNATSWNQLDKVSMWTCDEHPNQRWSVPAIVKFYPPAGYSDCAGEGGRCNFSGSYDVIYGAFEKFTSSRTFTNGVDCNNTVFGDPVPNYSKRCYYKASAQPPSLEVTPPSYSFGQVPLGKTQDFNFVVKNVGGGTLSGSASVAAPFSIVAGKDYNLVTSQTQNVTVRFTPTARTTYSTNVTFIGAPGTTNAPATRSVAGQGVAPVWFAPTPLLLPPGTVGGSAASAPLTVSNTGDAPGVFSVTSSNPSVISVSPIDSTPVPPNGTKQVTINAVTCSNTAPQTATLTISGGGSPSSPTIQVTRECKEAIPPATALSSINMSVDGKVLMTWSKVAGATSYGFRATFDGVNYNVSPDAPASGTGTASAVVSFLSGASDPAKSGKQLCIGIQAKNSGGASDWSGFNCTTYRYYTGIAAQSTSGLPKLWLEEAH